MNTKVVIAFIAMAFSLAGCSKAVVTMPEKTIVQPVPAAPVTTTQAPAQSQSERIAEIDRMLSAPLTGSPEDTDRRSALRAERSALTASGNYSMQADQSGRQITDSQGTPLDSGIVSRDAHANVANYVSPPPSNDQIVVAVDSQAGYLPGLEGMTPSERLHYFQALWLQNSQNINVTRNFGVTRRHFRRGF